MARDSERPNSAKVLAGLKDFQRATVEYVFARLYDAKDPAHRFLIADEVGLGKTLVARGLIAKATDKLWDSVERIDVVYICSNEDIARQNINRLNVTKKEEFSHASRVTLLPVSIQDLKHNKINFISFTPGTSFELGSSYGQAKERALLYWMLDHAWKLKGSAPLNVFQGGAGAESFRARVEGFQDQHEIDESLLDDFARALKTAGIGGVSMRERFDDLCRRFHRSDARVSREDQALRREFVGELRMLLAETCIRALQPDLIILDEFQRFKYLLERKDRTGELARNLFNYAEGEEKARVLLLSATPYKMYTLAAESENEDHYRDFITTLRFLVNDEGRTAELDRLIKEFRHELFRLGNHDPDRAIELREQIESRLRQVMVRTERLSVSPDRNGMLREMPRDGVIIEASDLKAYAGLQRIARELDQPDVIEYWKSAPYILNFMEDYEIKRAFKRNLETQSKIPALARLMQDFPGLLLRWKDVVGFQRLDPGNARLRALFRMTVETGAWKLLWIAPSLPYYELAGPYADPALQGFTKRLVFSAWRVVPKAIASLLSYEASRLATLAFDSAAVNTPQERERRQKLQLLRFRRDTDGRLTGMPVFALMYPCLTLAKDCDPRVLAAEALSEGNRATRLTLAEAIARLSDTLKPRLDVLAAQYARSETVDEAWYWAAPLLLDYEVAPGMTREWLMQDRLAVLWTGAEDGSQDETQEEGSAWADHVKYALALIEGHHTLGRPPEDLANIVAEIALAGFGTCALRALSRPAGGIAKADGSKARLAAARVGWAFRGLFNHGDVTALVRGLGKREPYWQRVLQYCAEGGLQAVLDEYAHILVESLGLLDREANTIAEEVGTAIMEALSIRPSQLGVDDISVEPASQRIAVESEHFACRFALQFSETKTEERAERTRTEKVREAFNSPFWPFVLASTSVGQEGLDFHPYCHAIVHWNLPANPVDMEQREGRVHRYKGHAVRKNLAKVHGANAIVSNGPDPWDEAFAMAAAGRANNTNDLVPFWIFPVESGAKIERYVPGYPLSRDIERLENMHRSLAVYRMVFGQPRQEDLLVYLIEHFAESEINALLPALRIDLSPALIPKVS